MTTARTRQITSISHAPPVAFIFTHRIQYFVNLLDELAVGGHIRPVAVYQRETASMRDPGFGRAIDWDNRPESSFQEILLKAGNANEQGNCNRTRRISSTLTALNPAAVHLNGFGKAIQWQALLWAWRRRVPVLLRGDGDMLSGTKRSIVSIPGAVARFFTSLAAHVFFQGEQNRRYWLARGADPKRMSWVPCVSDTTVFQAKVFANAAARQEFRGSHGVGERDVVFVVSGKLDFRKRPFDAIALLKHVASDSSSAAQSIRIWFLGSGPLEDDLKTLARDFGVADRVQFWGFLNQRQMPPILQAADALLHLSQADPWPYSVLDAASSGLALLLSDRTGSYPDWIMPPTACEVFRCGDITALAKAARRVAADAQLRSDLQHAAAIRSRLYSEREFSLAFERALFRVLSNPWHFQR